jgi:LPXTG-motif cell wall-anchored protein
VIDVLFVAALAIVLAGGIFMWRRRRRDPATEGARHAATGEAYELDRKHSSG